MKGNFESRGFELLGFLSGKHSVAYEFDSPERNAREQQQH